ncbi:MAG TPA: NAD(P)-binding domain-containing protein [Cyclobacteriaceae bacterium]|nr:NAD(P)-binding domain-containing protein [Cyclobacteriaceae bacterium]
MKIGIIGSGEMGVCLATQFSNLGHEVSITNSRGPASLTQLSQQLGIKAAFIEEVLNENEVIVVSIQQVNVPTLPVSLFENLSKEVVVIDTGNYYPTLRDGIIPGLEESGIDSLWVQQQLGRGVTKVFNSILATSLRDFGKEQGDRERITLAVSGDDAYSKEIVFRLVDELGFDSFDIGTIKDSWKQQPGSPIYCRDITLTELKMRVSALGSDWKVMREITHANRKSDEALMKADYQAYLKTLV